MIIKKILRRIFKLHRVVAIAFCLTLVISTAAYAANSLSKREHEPRQGYIQGISTMPVAAPEYILDVSDIIEVDVWHNEELNRVLQIRPDGRISMPLAGEIKASGLTPQQLTDIIRVKLKNKYILDPQVTVIVQKVQSKTILVLGHVNKPGLYGITKKITALKAIATAGGSTKFGHMESILVVRNPYSMKPAIYNIDLQSAITEGKWGNDMVLAAGDIVYVPKNFLGKIDDVMGFFRLNVQPSLNSYMMYRHVKAVEDND